MYFSNRYEAGDRLAKLLKKYKDDMPTLVALSDGAIIIAAQIAKKLECPITMLLAEAISAPGEPMEVASINQEGTYSKNSYYTSGQFEELDMEYHHIFEQEKLDKLQALHRQLGRNELINKKMLKGRTVILLADGLGSSATIDSAAIFLKSIKVKKLVIATPFAAVGVVDRMHLLADEILCLRVTQNFMGINHYYEDNTLPAHEVIIKSVQELVKKWQFVAEPKSKRKQSVY